MYGIPLNSSIHCRLNIVGGIGSLLALMRQKSHTTIYVLSQRREKSHRQHRQYDNNSMFHNPNFLEVRSGVVVLSGLNTTGYYFNLIAISIARTITGV